MTNQVQHYEGLFSAPPENNPEKVPAIDNDADDYAHLSSKEAMLKDTLSIFHESRAHAKAIDIGEAEPSNIPEDAPQTEEKILINHPEQNIIKASSVSISFNKFGATLVFIK